MYVEALCLVYGIRCDLLGSDTVTVTLLLFGVGLAFQPAGDGVEELIKFGDIEDPAGHQVDGDHNGSGETARDDGVGDRAHGPAARVPAERIEQRETEDPGGNGCPPGPNVG